ncbi:MAG: hypothetical protein WC966_04695 [Bradymonadales bacterium]|jgi:hypothetical protein
MAFLDLDLREIEVEYIAPQVSSGPEKITLMLTMVRGARGKRKLLGEAFTRTMFHPIIHFKVFDDKSVESLFKRFLLQLVHRGYRPVQYREMDLEKHFSPWKPCDLSIFDPDALAERQEAGMGIGEQFEDF